MILHCPRCQNDWSHDCIPPSAAEQTIEEIEAVTAVDRVVATDYSNIRAIIARTKQPDVVQSVCVHSMVRDDCLSCQKGAVARLQADRDAVVAAVREYEAMHSQDQPCLEPFLARHGRSVVTETLATHSSPKEAHR